MVGRPPKGKNKYVPVMVYMPPELKAMLDKRWKVYQKANPEATYSSMVVALLEGLPSANATSKHNKNTSASL